MFAVYLAGASDEAIQRGVHAGEALIAAYGFAPGFVEAAAQARKDGRAHDEEAARVWSEAEKAAIRAAFGASRSIAERSRSSLAQAS